jgi:hypothetical protein
MHEAPLAAGSFPASFPPRQSVLDHLAAARKSVDNVTIELVMESIGKTFERTERRATVI